MRIGDEERRKTIKDIRGVVGLNYYRVRIGDKVQYDRARARRTYAYAYGARARTAVAHAYITRVQKARRARAPSCIMCLSRYLPESVCTYVWSWILYY